MDKVLHQYIPGSSWLYYKIYTGAKTADLLLSTEIKSVTETLLAEGHIEQWFFIRYADPKTHVRLRLKVTQPDSIGKVIQVVYGRLYPMVNDDLVWNVQLGTYQPELRRYGRETIKEAEALFFRESEMIVSFLDCIDGEEGEEVRWLFAMRALDTLLDDFEYGEEEKLRMLDQLKTNFGAEFGINKHLKKQLDVKFRTHRSEIDKFLDMNRNTAGEYAVLLELLETKSTQTLTVIQQLKAKVSQERLNGLMSSYIHMLMNRMFRSKNRLHEMTVYQLLFRYYKMNWGAQTFKRKPLL